MPQHMLVPLDGSVQAEAVLPHAAALARASDAELLLFQVIAELREPAGWGPVPATVRDGWAETTLAQVHTGLDAVAARLQSLGISVQAEVLAAGDVAAAIVERAGQDPDIRMIAMATHGRSGLGRLLLGSVAEKVLHAVPRPLLLVRAREHMPALPLDWSYRRIAVPLDGSPFAECALQQAQAIAASTGADLALIGVVPALSDPALAEVGVVPGWLEAELQAEADHVGRYLAAIAARLAAEGFTVQPHLVAGAPAEQILATSHAEHADLIVMATHGRAGLQRLRIGSVATKVVHSAELPVLLVRAANG